MRNAIRRRHACLHYGKSLHGVVTTLSGLSAPQACVDVESMLIVSNHVSDCANDKRNLLPNLDAAKENGYKVTEVLGDTGYYSEANVKGCRERKIDACIAVEKQEMDGDKRWMGDGWGQAIIRENSPDVAAHSGRKTPGWDGRTRRSKAYKASQKVRKRR